MTSIQFQLFPMPQCCATCRFWGLGKYYRAAGQAGGDHAYCPIQEVDLDAVAGADLTRVVCESYRVEPVETDSVSLFFELSSRYNKPMQEVWRAISREYIAADPPER
jgi:hypothetical protein